MIRISCCALLCLSLAGDASGQTAKSAPPAETQATTQMQWWISAAAICGLVAKLAFPVGLMLGGLTFAAAWAARTGEDTAGMAGVGVAGLCGMVGGIADAAIMGLVPLAFWFAGWKVALLTALCSFLVKGVLEILLGLLFAAGSAGVALAENLISRFGAEEAPTSPVAPEHVRLPDYSADRSAAFLLRFVGRLYCPIQNKRVQQEQLTDKESRYWREVQPLLAYCEAKGLIVYTRRPDGTCKALRFQEIMDWLTEEFEPQERHDWLLPSLREQVAAMLVRAGCSPERAAEEIQKIVADEAATL